MIEGSDDMIFNNMALSLLLAPMAADVFAGGRTALCT
jgi:hypothetical protein